MLGNKTSKWRVRGSSCFGAVMSPILLASRGDWVYPLINLDPMDIRSAQPMAQLFPDNKYSWHRITINKCFRCQDPATAPRPLRISWNFMSLLLPASPQETFWNQALQILSLEAFLWPLLLESGLIFAYSGHACCEAVMEASFKGKMFESFFPYFELPPY